MVKSFFWHFTRMYSVCYFSRSCYCTHFSFYKNCPFFLSLEILKILTYFSFCRSSETKGVCKMAMISNLIKSRGVYILLKSLQLIISIEGKKKFAINVTLYVKLKNKRNGLYYIYRSKLCNKFILNSDFFCIYTTSQFRSKFNANFFFLYIYVISISQ